MAESVGGMAYVLLSIHLGWFVVRYEYSRAKADKAFMVDMDFRTRCSILLAILIVRCVFPVATKREVQ